MTTALDEVVLDEIRSRVDQAFENREATFDWILINYPRELGITQEEYGAQDLDPAVEASLREAIEHAFAEREREMETWPERTDNDRLQAAFDALGEQGIVTLECPGLTQTDSIPVAADLSVVRDEVRPRWGHGYCFFTWNDLHRAMDGDGLSLAYGTFEDEPEKSGNPESPPAVASTAAQSPCPLCEGRGWIAPERASEFPTPCACKTSPPAAVAEPPAAAPGLGEKVGAMVLQACLDAGLKAKWDGRGTSFVEIPNFSWQRRLVRSRESDVRDFLESWEIEIRAGYTPAQDLRGALEERASEWFEKHSDFGPALRNRLSEHTLRFLEEEHEREVSWTDATMNDRISGAFADLHARGIHADECSGLTIQDGWGYAGVAADPSCRGVVFFHREDVIDGVAGRGLMLAFGAVRTEPSDDDAGSEAVAREILMTLAGHGVPASWSGSLSERIRIAPFEWRNRRWTPEPEYARAANAATIVTNAKTELSEEASIAAPEAGIVVKALRDEGGFDLRRSQKLRDAWKTLGREGEAQAAHLGIPHVFVRARSYTSMMPQLAVANLRAEKNEIFLRGARAEKSE